MSTRKTLGLSSARCLIFIFLLAGIWGASAQSGDRNYIRTDEILTPNISNASQIDGLTGDSIRTTIVYYDGLGRQLQTIIKNKSPNQNDIIQHFEYDQFGRMPKSFLPFTYENGNNGEFVPAAADKLLDYYRNPEGMIGTSYPYHETLFENSPLNRILETASPGENFSLDSGNQKEIVYGTNTYEEVHLWSIDAQGKLSNNAYYEPQTVYKTTFLDENKNISVEYKDMLGRVVLFKTSNDSVWHETHYVYNDLGLLSFVIMPAANTSGGVFDYFENCFSYLYDGRKRLIEKKIPGAETIQYVYDAKDRLVAEQDGNMRNSSPALWKFYKYDVFNRPVIEGFYESDLKRFELQDYINSNPSNYELDEGRSPVQPQIYHGYTNLAFPDIDSCQILLVNYYDDYGFNGDSYQHYDSYFLYHLSDVALRTVKGQLTATKSINEDQTMIMDVFFYDKYYRLLQTCTLDEALRVYYHTGNYYSFGGHITKTNKRFSMPGHPLLFYTFEFDYDHDWRLVSTTLNINNEPEYNVINYLEYHETGLPGTKHLHGSSQNSMYSWQHNYNPRGWLTSLKSNTPAQLFNLDLFYDELPGEASSNASAQYNGNINAMHWSTQGIDGKMGGYEFEYDNLNRLTNATFYYRDASNNLYRCENGGSNPDPTRAIIGIGSVFDIGYDKNGNIQALTRIGRTHSGWQTFDHLTYTYDTDNFPNRLKAVDDAINGQNNLGDFHDNGYKYHQLGQAEYLYDHNGNMISDLNRSLTLEYALGTYLPERVIHTGGHIRNYYTPAGRKTGKKVFDASNNLLSQELYYGDLIIKDGRASRILHGDGVVNLSGEPPLFHYHIKDHLGNVRLVITPDTSNNPLVLQANDYYPFGMSYSTAPGVNKYLYNSKEEQEMPGKFLDYGWRMYDAQLGRWHGVDNMSEQRYWLSPFNYVQNNPIIRIDPDGNIDWEVVGRGALITTGGVASLAAAAFITPTGIGIPAAGYMGAQGIAGVSFGISTMVIGFASESSQETKDLAKSMPTDFNDLAAITYEKHTGDEGGNARTIAQGASILTGAGLTKLAPSLPNAIKSGSELISIGQASLLVSDELKDTNSKDSKNESNSSNTHSEQKNNFHFLNDEHIGSLPR